MRLMITCRTHKCQVIVAGDDAPWIPTEGRLTVPLVKPGQPDLFPYEWELDEGSLYCLATEEAMFAIPEHKFLFHLSIPESSNTTFEFSA